MDEIVSKTRVMDISTQAIKQLRLSDRKTPGLTRQGEMLLVCSEFSWMTRVAIAEIMKLSKNMNMHHHEIMYDNKETAFLDKNDVSVVQKNIL